MNKKEIIGRMARDAGITAVQAARAFSSMMEGIKNSLKSGEKVTFSGFGSFEVKERKARKGRNPKTGAEVAIPPRKRVRFNPSKRFKNSL
ncbi:MAG: HU family DNA-binding protein [Candidatus Aminicenantes bacterium]|nr:HU family DNA-binding protein [Candidatus Aminicenantes bacterium]